MTPYAHYAAQLQPGDIPLSVVLFQQKPVKPAICRRISFAMDRLEDFTAAGPYHERKKPVTLPKEKKPTVFEKYAAVLSKRKWTSSSEVAEALGYAREAVNKFLSAHREKLHKRQENTGKGFLVNYWKLK